MFITLVRTDNSPVQLFSRVALGMVMFTHGGQKVFGWYGGEGFTRSLELFAVAGVPSWLAAPWMVLEVGGALLLMIGILTRLWALGFTVSTVASLLMSWSGQQQAVGLEYHLLVLGMVAGLIVRGGGLLSLDRAITPDSEVL